jgi:[ribulose-bisphosphate carboxylase]/[fructose-bisphosphate aldolase]-lysine N-methyltransferase
MESIFRTEAWGHMMDPVSMANEEAVCTSMASGCKAALAAYSTSLSDDLKVMDACSDPSSEMFLALQARMVRAINSLGSSASEST